MPKFKSLKIQTPRHVPSNSFQPLVRSHTPVNNILQGATFKRFSVKSSTPKNSSFASEKSEEKKDYSFAPANLLPMRKA